ncbi:MAG: DUF2252 domain-containing protein [Acidimicrobiales bacterium]
MTGPAAHDTAPDLDAPSGGNPERAFSAWWRRRRLTVEERVARGRAARATAPRSSHRRFEPAPDRADPVGLIAEQGADRVTDLLPIRYGRMLESPFTFFRGAAAVMSGDLAVSPVSGVTVQLCGDAHLSNFGLFATPERRMIFDINDFDETLPGPWEWDVKRLAASFEVMGRSRGFSHADRRDVVLECLGEYRGRMRGAAAAGTLEAWYDHLEVGHLLDEVRAELRHGRLTRKEHRHLTGSVDKARSRDHVRVFTRRVGTVGDDLRIVADPPLIVPIEDLIEPGSSWEQSETFVKNLLASYRSTLGVEHHPLEEFRYVHAARKVVGVGSVGTRCYILLLVGRDDRDPLVLQVKEAQSSVLERYLGASGFPHHGTRVVAGQRLMQGATDAFLGWQRIEGLDGKSRDYYVRQLHDGKGGADVDVLGVAGATLYARICGATLARAHARWGDRIAIAAYLGKGDRFDRAIAEFASRYADQNERDYEALLDAVKAGRLEAVTGV